MILIRPFPIDADLAIILGRHDDALPADELERIAIQLTARARWPSGIPSCPYCADTRVSVLTKRLLYRCKNCDRTFSVRVGTIFQGSRTPLRHWLLAVGLATQEATSSVVLARHLEIKQGAAWRILNALRTAASTESFHTAIAGMERLPSNLWRIDQTPAPTAATFRVGYQPKFFLPMPFSDAVRRFLAVGTLEARQARATLSVTKHRVATNRPAHISMPEFFEGADESVEAGAVVDARDTIPRPE